MQSGGDPVQAKRLSERAASLSDVSVRRLCVVKREFLLLSSFGGDGACAVSPLNRSFVRPSVRLAPCPGGSLVLGALFRINTGGPFGPVHVFKAGGCRRFWFRQSIGVFFGRHVWVSSFLMRRGRLCNPVALHQAHILLI